MRGFVKLLAVWVAVALVTDWLKTRKAWPGGQRLDPSNILGRDDSR